MSLLRKAILVNSTVFAGLALGVLQISILSRVLGPVGVGQYAIVLSALVTGAQLCCLGLPISFLYHSQHDREYMQTYLMNAIWATLFLSILGGLCLVVLILTLPGYFGKLPWYVILGVGLYVPIVLQRAVSYNSLMVLIEAKRLSLMTFLGDAGNVFLICIFYVLGYFGTGQAIMCFILAAVIRAGTGWNWMRHRVDFSIKPNWQVTRKLVFMGIRQSWSDLMILINGQISIMIIQYLMRDFESVGYFTRGHRIAMLAVMGGRAVLPLLFSRWASIGRAELARHVAATMRLATSISVLLIIALWLFGKTVILILLGREYLPAVGPMMIQIPGAAMYLLSITLMQVLGSQGSPEISAILLLICGLVNAVLACVLVPSTGIIGAAWASTASHVLLLLCLVVVVRRKYDVKIRHSLVLTRADLVRIKKALRGRGAKRV